MTPIPPHAQSVLDFWFGPEDSPQHGLLRDDWFSKSSDFDAQIARRFGDLVESALRGELLDWTEQPASALARILLLDQFTRNIFRDTPKAFAGDALALVAADAMVASEQDLRLLPVQRAFVYLPFEHAEALPAQDEAVRLFERLSELAPETAGMLDYAHRHHAVIARFGRFPHRNEVLGRRSTEDESEFLKQAGSRF